MNRINRIYRYVKENTHTLTEWEIDSGQGLTTKLVAEALDIQRSNVSKDLNQLVREGKLAKTEGRPVRYYHVNLEPHQPLTKHVPSYKEAVTPQAKVKRKTHNETDVFRSMIGASGSMKNAVEQAKAAVLYPPKGLNTLITGPTGSGKSYFAHAMFHYAQSNGIISSDKELIVFNCADYANNPQLLMSHLFGYSQGAFTGANADKEGLIQQADLGMLFLDEIHRLPPEGQEMIFYFMDTGMYSRLGESGKSRTSTVRIVCATTEDPRSTFLDTFMRRIPIVIQLPSFKKRSAGEQLDLVKLLTSLEATRIQKQITLSEDVIKALIASVGYGNIGQLKSGIQLVCARGFMNQLDQDNITLTARDLPESIRAYLINKSSNARYRSALSKITEAQITVYPNEPFYQIGSEDAYELPYNLYDIIGDKATLLEAEGLDQESINQYISTDINVHLKSFYRNHGFSLETDSRLADVVSKDVIQFVHSVSKEIETALATSFKHNYIYAVSLHISAFLNKIETGEVRQLNDRIKEMAMGYTTEIEVATLLKERIARHFDIEVPESEVYYLAVLLVSLQEEQTMGRVGLVIVAHGNSTATSMAQVAEELLELSGIIAVDMPLDMSPRVAYEKVKQAVVQANEGNGVLLLVDMGSLTTFESNLTQETGVHIRTIDMVSTALVLEAARKASLVDADIDLLHESLDRFLGYSSTAIENKNKIQSLYKSPVLVAICASGEGTAQKLKEIIEKPLAKQPGNPLRVLTSSITDLKANIALWEEDYTIVATTGVINPKLSAPFIPLENFIENDVENVLGKLNHLVDVEPSQTLEDVTAAKQFIKNFIETNYTFLNTNKIFPFIWDFVVACRAFQAEPEPGYAFHINLSLHMAGVIERLVHQDSLAKPKIVGDQQMNPMLLNEIKKFEHALKIKIPVNEYLYISYFIEKEKAKIEEIDTLFD
ncbi:Transcriptional regulatory protein DagR [Jeotgalibaca dankookensis]|uniref:Transcriptional regulatory protein DagR n=1 Tax=Jeotgalibaca dankookensis TaxID=708126 RepID=A0A1S6IQG6_9LACT|nr:sigma-54-dependent transcriptional regulator [Jeotgalibaca dankookensis]AQS53792.1 Transcriptional regulatory protein DagR [Jeotgalibaca dankookensis]